MSREPSRCRLRLPLSSAREWNIVIRLFVASSSLPLVSSCVQEPGCCCQLCARRSPDHEWQLERTRPAPHAATGAPQRVFPPLTHGAASPRSCAVPSQSAASGRTVCMAFHSRSKRGPGVRSPQHAFTPGAGRAQSPLADVHMARWWELGTSPWI